MKNKKNILGILLVIMFLIILFNYSYVKLYRKGSYKFISQAAYGNFANSNEENVYLSLLYVKKIKGEEEINELLKSFLNPANKNGLTQYAAIRYISENKKTEYLDELKILQKNAELVNQLNPDSTWIIFVGSNYKLCGFNDYYINYVNKAIKRLEDIRNKE